MFKNLSNDLPAGIVVFLVAVPLCLGIALASGAPLFSGIIAGIVGGIIVGVISGSKFGVSGPAAGLTVIVADAIVKLGTNSDGIFNMQTGFPIFLVSVVIAGVIQIGLAFAKAGIIGYYFPSSVIKGMLSAIGIIIVLKQIPHALGHDVIAEGFEGFNQPDGENTFTELMVAVGDINPAAAILTLISLGVLILWEQGFMKRQRVFQIVQGPLIVVVVGILFSRMVLGMEDWSFAEDEMVTIPLMAEVGGFQGMFTFPKWSAIFSADVWIIGFTIAIVASLETLLCVEATDKLDPDKGVTPTNRELIAQGAGNIASGLIGGLPVTQVIVRSSANMQSGGKTKMATIIHGVLIAVSVFILPEVLNMIPLSSLAAILFLVGYKLATPKVFKEMASKGRDQFIPFLVTILAIIFTDLLIGIGIGLVVGIFQILYKDFSLPFSYSEKTSADERIEIKLSENVSFLNKAGIQKAISVIPDNSRVLLNATQSHYIHPDVIEILKGFIDTAPNRGIEVEVLGDFDTINLNHVKYFLKKVSQKESDQPSYLKSVFMH